MYTTACQVQGVLMIILCLSSHYYHEKRETKAKEKLISVLNKGGKMLIEEVAWRTKHGK
jgi:predicted glycosyltransferase